MKSEIYLLKTARVVFKMLSTNITKLNKIDYDILISEKKVFYEKLKNSTYQLSCH